jgi:hypothetical protein
MSVYACMCVNVFSFSKHSARNMLVESGVKTTCILNFGPQWMSFMLCLLYFWAIMLCWFSHMGLGGLG